MQNQLDKKQVKQHFEKAACSYDKSAVLQTEVNQRLLERLQYMRILPNTILDIGCGTAKTIRKLRNNYPKADILGLDIALSMLKQAPRSLWHKPLLICGDMEQLPIASNSIDLVFSNLAIQWANDLESSFKEWKRVLKQNGLLLFSTFGPDTLKELRQSFANIDQTPHVNQFIDMHDIGDLLVQQGFSDPVIDIEYFTLTYDKVMGLLKDLHAIGAYNAHAQRRRTLTGKTYFQLLEKAYEVYRIDSKLPATYEVIYGHAWILNKQSKIDNQVYIPLAQLKKPS